MDTPTTEIYTLSLHDALPILLGATLASGRLFEPGDDLPGRAPSAILSDATWTRRYGRDPSMLGRTIRLKDRKSTRLNSSHSSISYAVFCLKKKKTQKHDAYLH